LDGGEWGAAEGATSESRARGRDDQAMGRKIIYFSGQLADQRLKRESLADF